VKKVVDLGDKMVYASLLNSFVRVKDLMKIFAINVPQQFQRSKAVAEEGSTKPTL
jgi:hypothetical protein